VLLRQEGLYPSHLSTRHELRRQGTLKALTSKQPGPQASLGPAQRRVLKRLPRRNAKLEHELDKSRTIIDDQKNSKKAARHERN
jgi:hypothetical protein